MESAKNNIGRDSIKQDLPNSEDQKIVDLVFENKQEHVFRFWRELSSEERHSLLSQIKEIDFSLLSSLKKTHLSELEGEGKGGLKQSLIQPPKLLSLKDREKNKEHVGQAKELGENLLRSNKVAILLVAGGQGTRLGFDGPKGCFKITPVKNKSLFAFQAEQISALEELYGCTLPWYIMTSDATDTQTKDFFHKKDYFNLDKSNIVFFKQSQIPTLSKEGKLLLSNKYTIATNPDGHGGVIAALSKSGALEDMEKRGIRQVFYYQVDNALVKIADPLFLGIHDLTKSDVSTKIVRKTDPNEKVGLIVEQENTINIIEYSDLSEEKAKETDSEGNLRFFAGNTAIHAFSLSFLKTITTKKDLLPFHKAQKSIFCLNEEGESVKSDPSDTLKFEKFIFDVLPLATNAFVLEVDREKEFAPVKNTLGKDSPDSARKLLQKYFSWLLQENGMAVAVDKENNPLFTLELSQKLFASLQMGDDFLLEKYKKEMVVLEEGKEYYFE